MSQALLFFRNFLANPFAVGSVLPSGRHLVRDLLAGVDFTTAKVVVEYGPGTGVFTAEILERLAPDATFLCIELNDEFYAALKAQFSDPRMVLIHGSAADIERYLAECRLGKADAIVSGLPFTSLPSEVRHLILAATSRVLKPHARFVLYQYSMFMGSYIKTYFGKISTRYTLLNFPPAFSFYCDAPTLATNELGEAATPVAQEAV